MKLQLTCLFASLLASALGHNHVSQAAIAIIDPLTSGGASGVVRVAGGVVSVNLNLTSFNASASRNAAVTCNDISYHIHVQYVQNPANAADPLNFVSNQGTQCDSTQTGGHYDPWYACGPATNEKAFCNNGNNGDMGCINRGGYNCNSTNFMANPMACEVGDWSGKYGVLAGPGPIYSGMSTTAVNPPSKYEISTLLLYSLRMSVVFHCNNGARVLCAPFLPENQTAVNTTAPVPGIDAATAAGTRQVADFGTLNGPMLQFGGGEVRVDQASIINFITVIVPLCQGSLPVFQVNAGPIPGGVPFATGNTCAMPLFDPTVRCPAGSSMTAIGYCAYNATSMLSTRCPANATAMTFNYTADVLGFFPEYNYRIAQGTLFINLATVTAQTTVLTVPYPLLDMNALMGKSVTMSCMNNPTMPVMCANIQTVPSTYTMRTMAPTTSAPTATNPTASPTTSPPGTMAPTATNITTTGAAGRVAAMYGIMVAAAVTVVVMSAV